MSRIRVVIADDHPLYRAGVVRVFGRHPELEVVGEVEDGRAAVQLIRELRPDVAVIDLDMPGVDGYGVMDAIRFEELGARVVLLSGRLDSTTAYAAIERGAAGVVSKVTDAEELLATVVAVARGEVVIGSDIQGDIAAEIRMRSTDDRPALSGREREILSRMAEGESIRVMAQAMHLSQSTIKNHVENLYRKLGVSDRAAAVAVALRRGMLH